MDLISLESVGVIKLVRGRGDRLTPHPVGWEGRGGSGNKEEGGRGWGVHAIIVHPTSLIFNLKDDSSDNCSQFVGCCNIIFISTEGRKFTNCFSQFINFFGYFPIQREQDKIMLLSVTDKSLRMSFGSFNMLLIQ